MTQSRRPSPLQRRVLIVLAALDEKRPGPVLTRDIERVLEQSGEAPVYGPNLRATCFLFSVQYVRKNTKVVVVRFAAKKARYRLKNSDAVGQDVKMAIRSLISLVDV